jgi:hypothetical protein
MEMVIADIDDRCPDVAGLTRYQGCPVPDTDKEGSMTKKINARQFGD